MWVFIANYFTVGIDAYLWLTKNKVYAMFMPCLCFFGQNCIAVDNHFKTSEKL